jgi:hypothetical protein
MPKALSSNPWFIYASLLSFTGKGLSTWDVSSVYNMTSMFKATERYVHFREKTRALYVFKSLFLPFDFLFQLQRGLVKLGRVGSELHGIHVSRYKGTFLC